MDQFDDSETMSSQETDEVAGRTIQDLVDVHPEILGLLAPLGLDLCCGGAHPLGEALDLHGIDRGPVLARVAQIISDPRRGEG